MTGLQPVTQVVLICLHGITFVLVVPVGQHRYPRSPEPRDPKSPRCPGRCGGAGG
ncbi:hypothetical protein ppKF707_4221 [Metapseudomonas furukawaii]|uniref:Uncharacterized protein n=1 Tax=Metapseudomonas furukawaii TaxID=1149133 RepID=A0AAD1C2V5_METFU|nr:hypothetical protein ppKF707_4221 [Pseudomonas furukawaii]BAU75803.1 hypothetical protein KF707C_41150 [Pseudomonas furukawaii]